MLRSTFSVTTTSSRGSTVVEMCDGREQNLDWHARIDLDPSRMSERPLGIDEKEVDFAPFRPPGRGIVPPPADSLFGSLGLPKPLFLEGGARK